VLLASLVLVTALGLVGLALNSANYRGAVSSLEARMESYVYQVLAAVDVDREGRLTIGGDLGGEMGDPRLVQPGSGVYVHVHGQADHWSSPSALGLELPELPDAAPGRAGFAEPGAEAFAGAEFFTYQYGVVWQVEDGPAMPFTVTVLVQADEPVLQTSAFRLGLWRALGATGAILLLFQLLMIYVGFRPLRRVAQDVAGIESGKAPRLQGHYPVELEPLARNINHLLASEQASQRHYRNALDSLAHSLKTPLAVIRAGLELDGAEAKGSMRKAADDMNVLIATRLERAAASTRRALGEPLAVAPRAERVIGSLDKVYSHKMIETDVTLPPELEFYGEERDLLELMGNLLDNAYKYGVRRVRLTAGAIDAQAPRSGLWIRVEDDGRGIAPELRRQLLQRGARGDERVEGHGLGLAIVVELVTAYGGQVSIGDSDLGGAMLSVRIPASRAAGG
jgi:two-component system sensor histidine kinase PhoQ